MRKFLICLLAMAAPVQARSLYWQSGDTAIYDEEQSCVLYRDFDHGMLRISDRVDQDRVYVSVTSPDWETLSERQGANVTMGLTSPDPRLLGAGSAVQVFRNSNGWMGFSGGDFTRDVLDLIAKTPVLQVRLAGPNLHLRTLLDIGMQGSAAAVVKLRECSAHH